MFLVFLDGFGKIFFELLSVTYFPSLRRPFWVDFGDSKRNKYNFKYSNCYLHEIRCHEEQNFRDQNYIDGLIADTASLPSDGFPSNGKALTKEEILVLQKQIGKKGIFFEILPFLKCCFIPPFLKIPFSLIPLS